MADLYHVEEGSQLVCWDRKYYSTYDDQLKVLATSKTVYVGPINRIIMGLNQKTKTPCGFCFVEYYRREHAAACLKFISGTICDDRIIRCDMDGGFRDGRQFGRGPSGGQMRDDRRASHDPARGGVVGGGALIARRPAYKPSTAGGENTAPIALGKKRGRDDDDEQDESAQNLDSFGRDRDGGSIKKRLSEGLSASRPPPRTAETEPHAVVSEEAVAMEEVAEVDAAPDVMAETA